MSSTSAARASAFLLLTACVGSGPRDVSLDQVCETALDFTTPAPAGGRAAPRTT